MSTIKMTRFRCPGYCITLIIFGLRMVQSLTGVRDPPMNLEFISILPQSLPVGGALPWTGAAMDLALESVNRRFGATLNLTVTRLYRKEDRTCEDSEAYIPGILAEHYYTRVFGQCVAVMASKCGSARFSFWRCHRLIRMA